jgi:hypothetical protein
MESLAKAIAVLAILGAAVSWVLGVLFYLRTLYSISGEDAGKVKWLAVFAWPFAMKRLSGAAADHAAKVNKALVTFFACVMIAAAAISVAANLSRYSR